MKPPISPFRVLQFDYLLEGRCTEMTQVKEKSLFAWRVADAGLSTKRLIEPVYIH